MIHYWTNLSERDQRTLTIGICSIIAYMFYLLVYSPLNGQIERKIDQLTEKKETLLWMQQIRQQNTGEKAHLKISNSKLLTIITSESTLFQTFPYQIQQMGSGDIQLIFDKVPYTPFLTWFLNLTKQYAITLKQLTMDRSKTPGVVKLLMIISAK